jgi:hypothetical protein
MGAAPYSFFPRNADEEGSHAALHGVGRAPSSERFSARACPGTRADMGTAEKHDGPQSGGPSRREVRRLVTWEI